MSVRKDYTNQLVNETSPYLLQHAHNPVHWYPWGEAALTRARQENKLIFLSIGYSACHWCHVMAHESFEDPETAKVLNSHFISIKVDREERPDLDKIYQTAHQILNQRAGGWPLSVFLTPDDQMPFFSGTYFPLKPRHGLPAFKQLLGQLHEAYHEQTDEIRSQNQSLQKLLQSINPSGSPTASFDATPLKASRAQLEQHFDPQFGGFGKAPKFPHPSHLERLLRYWHWTERSDASGLGMACTTLKKMAMGGLFDHLEGGFYRYSTDDYWMIPHFEKMLYDNALLIPLYTDAALATDQAFFRRVVDRTAHWVLTQMQAPQGGYYSAIDADSEGQEGKFYVWTPEQVQSCLTESEYALFAARYGLDRNPNFEGHWHLHVYQDIKSLAKESQLSYAQVNASLETARCKLLQVRSTRVAPGRDEKILVAWNALMIKALASAGSRFHNEQWIESAQRAMDFIHRNLWQNQRLLATYKDGKAHLNAYLDDYAFLIDAGLALLQARWNTQLLKFTSELAEVLLEQFEDKSVGGFFFTGNDHEALIHRPKPYTDDAMPAGNAIAVSALQRLGLLLGENRYIEAAQRALSVAWEPIQQMPTQSNALLNGLEDCLTQPSILIARAPREAVMDPTMLDKVGYRPNLLSFFIANDEPDLPAPIAAREGNGAWTIYICKGSECSMPFTDLDTALQTLDAPAG